MKHVRLGMGWRVVTWLVLFCTTAWSVQAQQLLDAASGAGAAAGQGAPRLIEVDSDTGQPEVSSGDAVVFLGFDAVAVSRSFRSALPAHGLGPGWRLSCDERVVTLPDGSARIDAAAETVKLQAGKDGEWQTASGSLGVLKKTPEGYRLDLPGPFVREFDKDGRLVRSSSPQTGFSVKRAPDGLAKAVADRGGKRLILTAEDGRYTSVQDPAGSTWKYSYDAKGRLVEVARPAGLRERYAYDDSDRLTSVDRGFGKVILRYDARGRVVKQAADGEGGFLERRTYSESAGWNEVKVELPGGLTSFLRTSSDGRTIELTDEIGIKRSGLLSVRKQPLSVKADGREILAATFDDRGLCQSLALNGVASSFSYSADGRMTGIKAPDREVKLELDAAGRLVRMAESTGESLDMSYNAGGQCTGAIQKGKNGQEELFSVAYDEKGNLSRLATRSKGVLTFTADAVGRISGFDDGTKKYVLAYDGESRVTAATQGGAEVVGAQYDPRGLPVKVAGPKGTLGFEYAQDGNLAGVTGYTGGRTGFKADSLRRVTELTNAGGQTFKVDYDAKGRVTGQTVSGVSVFGMAYDEEGKLSQIRKGQVPVNCQYDASGRLTTADAGACGTVKYTYAASGEMAGMMDSSGESLEIRDGVTTYRNAGSPAAVTWQKKDAPGGSLAQIAVKGMDLIARSYDAQGQLIRIESPAGPFQFVYDAQGRRAALEYPNGTRAGYGYASNGALQSLTLADKQGGVVEKRTYVRDSQGRCVRMDLQDGSARGYAYDADGRLVRVTDEKGTEIERYQYDRTGNLVASVVGGKEERAGYDQQGRLVSLGERTFTYDAEGRRTGEKPSSGPAREYTYDGMNRLVGVKTGDSSVQYGYSVLGSRLWSQKSGEPRRIPLYVGADVVAETDDKGAILAGYVHGSDMDEVLASRDASGTWVYHHRDALQSLRTVTDKEGRKLASVSYTGFGIPDAGAARFTYLYAGRDWEPLSGHYFNRARHYDPGTAQFLTLDPVGLAGGVLPYAYCFYDPVNLRDPTGTWIWAIPVALGIIGGVLEYVRQKAMGEQTDLISIAISILVGVAEPVLGPYGAIVNAVASIVDDLHKMAEGSPDAPKGLGEVLVGAIVSGLVGLLQGPGLALENVVKKAVIGFLKKLSLEGVKNAVKEVVKGISNWLFGTKTPSTPPSAPPTAPATPPSSTPPGGSPNSGASGNPLTDPTGPFGPAGPYGPMGPWGPYGPFGPFGPNGQWITGSPGSVGPTGPSVGTTSVGIPGSTGPGPASGTPGSGQTPGVGVPAPTPPGGQKPGKGYIPLDAFR